MAHGTKLGITGHQRLDDESQWPRIHADLRTVISAGAMPLVGLTSLAIGADQMFADLVLELGGTIEVIIPFAAYESTFESGLSLQRYRGLLARAKKVVTLPPKPTDQDSYLDAGKLVAELSDKLIAVWDGKEADGLGGTGDIVSYAKQIGRPVILISVKS
jgi:hypothetical protein